MSHLIGNQPHLIRQAASQGLFTHQSQMEFRWRGVLAVELNWRKVQRSAINRAKAKVIFESFTARIASLHGNLLVLAVVNFGRGEFA